jgi:prevent-host-death family protein
MKKVGSYEAKTRLPGLLEEVRRGARISITRRGVPVAMLVPASPDGKRDRGQAIRNLRDFRKGITLGDVSIREMIEEGRLP